MSTVTLYIDQNGNSCDGITPNKAGSCSYKETITTGEGKSATTSQITYKFNVVFKKLDYQKKMYEPCEMHASLTVTSETKLVDDGGVESVTLSQRDLMKMFKNAKVKLTIATKDVATQVVATNYFVYKVRLFFKKNNTSDVDVELDIFSEDKRLALHKYSKAYTAKKLGADIFGTEVKNYNLTSESSKNLQMLMYRRSDESEDASSTDEFRQPYLVQYNETFYDFLKRTANRCGEFLYFEGGQLHLGIDSADKTGTDYATKAKRYYYDSLYNDSVFSKEDVVVEDYAYDYLKNDTMDDVSKMSPDNENYHYNDPLSQDEYLGEIGNTITNYDKEWGLHDKNAMSFLMKALEGTSLSAIFLNISIGLTLKAICTAIEQANKNEDHQEDNITPWTDKKDQWNADKELLCQFATYGEFDSDLSDKQLNLTHNFYSLIRAAEKKVEEDVVYLEFDCDYQDLSLGDKIKVGSDMYIVVKINGSYSLDSNGSSSNLSDGSSSNLSDGSSSNLSDGSTPKLSEVQNVVAIPMFKATTSTTDDNTKLIPIPPVLPDLMIRESQPQLAIVKGTSDPKEIGRVRVRFVWQKDNEDASPWIRVSLPFATNGGGVKFIPEEGDEVLVSFEEGNVERPYVSGYLLSPRHNERWRSLPDRTITSKNGHSITFDDDTDGASFFYNLWPGLSLIKSFFPTSTWPDQLDDSDGCIALSGGMTIQDRYGLYKIACSSSDRSIEIQSAMGDVTLSAFTGISISAPNGNISISGKNVDITASNKVNITSGTAIKNRFFGESGDAKERFKQFGMELLKGVAFDLPTSIADKFIDLPLIRTVIEIVTRPIDGTTRIKSFTFVQIEAGKGSAKYINQTQNPHNDSFYTKFAKAVEVIPGATKNLVNELEQAYKAVSASSATFMGYSKKGSINHDCCVINFDEIRNKAWTGGQSDYDWSKNKKPDDFNQVDAENKLKNILKLKLKSNLEKRPDGSDNFYKQPGNAKYIKRDQAMYDKLYDLYITQAKDKIKKDQNAYDDEKLNLESAVTNLENSIKELKKIVDILGNVQENDLNVTNPNFDYKDEVIASFKELKKVLEKDDFLKKIINKNFSENDVWRINRKIVKKAIRTIIVEFVDKIQPKSLQHTDLRLNVPTKNVDFENDTVWKGVVDKFVNNPKPEPQKGLKKYYREWCEDVSSLWGDAIKNRHQWSTGTDGKILMSDEPDTVFQFNNNTIFSKYNDSATTVAVQNIINKIKSM